MADPFSRDQGTRAFRRALALRAGAKAGVPDADNALDDLLSRYSGDRRARIEDDLDRILGELDKQTRDDLERRSSGSKKAQEAGIKRFDVGHKAGHGAAVRGIVRPPGGFDQVNEFDNFALENSRSNQVLKGRRLEQEFLRAFDAAIDSGMPRQKALEAGITRVRNLAAKRISSLPIPEPGGRKSVKKVNGADTSPMVEAYHRVLKDFRGTKKESTEIDRHRAARAVKRARKRRGSIVRKLPETPVEQQRAESRGIDVNSRMVAEKLAADPAAKAKRDLARVSRSAKFKNRARAFAGRAKSFGSTRGRSIVGIAISTALNYAVGRSIDANNARMLEKQMEAQLAPALERVRSEFNRDHRAVTTALLSPNMEIHVQLAFRIETETVLVVYGY